MSAPAPERNPVVTTAALAESFRTLQLAVRAQMLRDSATAWAALDFDRLGATWPGWLRLMTALIGRYHGDAARQAALYYLATRQAQTGVTGPPPAGIAVAASAPSALWIERALGFAAPGTYQRQIGSGATPDIAVRHALTQTLGTASRITLDGGRQTIHDAVKRDKTAVGFYRVTDGDPCAFCALMASRVVRKDNRGRFYKSAQTAGLENKWHNDCGCTVVPAFSRDLELPESSVLADAIYRDGNGSLNDFRKAWDEHRANRRPAMA